MDSRSFVNVCACAAVAGVPFALVGLFFGGFAGWLTARTGRAAGGRIGRVAARGLEGRPVAASTVACGVDGAVFLGAIGLVVGGVGGWDALPYAVVGLLVLAGSAVVFGGYAYLLVHRRFPILAAVCGALIGGAAGAVVAVGAARWTALGALAGILLGIARCWHVPPASLDDPGAREATDSVPES